MGIDYRVSAGYGIVIKDAELRKLGVALEMDPEYYEPYEVMGEFLSEIGSDNLEFGTAGDYMSSSDTDAWISVRGSSFSGEVGYDLQPGLQIVKTPDADSAARLAPVRQVLDIFSVKYEEGNFVGFTVS